MSLTSQRYKIAPQLKDYDCLPTDWRPYTMFRQASKYSSDSVNTDETGQRLSFDRNGNPLSFSNLDGPFDLIVGASSYHNNRVVIIIALFRVLSILYPSVTEIKFSTSISDRVKIHGGARNKSTPDLEYKSESRDG